jgi:hypothetical protein
VKKYPVVLLFLTLFLFSGCTTLETYIPNETRYSNVIPIEKKQTFLFFGEKLSLNEYSLRYKGSSPGLFSYSIFSTYNKNITGRRYVFYKNEIQQCTVDLISSDRELKIGDLTITYDMEVAIVISNNYSREEFRVNLNEEEPYVLFNDRNLGEIRFDYYKSRNKNTPQYDYESLTGLEISVNNQEYGILAFYSPALYLKNAVEVNDKTALFILAAYTSFLYNDYK